MSMKFLRQVDVSGDVEEKSTKSTGFTQTTEATSSELLYQQEYDSEQIKSLLAFSPNILINQLKTSSFNNGNKTPQSITFSGAALLSDISGFSKFAGVQCARGVLGLSDLHEATNGFLGHFVNTVYRYGGDVLAFAGDALLCVFINDPYNVKDSPSSTRIAEPYLSVDCNVRALECALELRQFSTADLSTHISVSSGEMKLAILGGRNNEWVYLLNGLPVAQLECLTDAGSKQVVCTPVCLENASKAIRQLGVHNSNSIVTTRCASGNFLITGISSGVTPSKECNRVNNLVDVTSEEVILSTRQFIPKPVLIAINSNILDRIAELRQVVTMFISLDSYSPEVHRDPMTLQPFFSLVQESLQKTGGYMRQFVIDDKGCVVIGMWGLPQYSYANNGPRALFAAANIRNQARDMLKLKCSVGVTTGFVFCGGVGAAGRKDYVVMGADVNMAARFMGKANGRVLVDVATKKRLPILLQNSLKAVELMKLKGALTDITPYEFPGEDILNTISLDGDSSQQFETASELRKNARVVLNKQLDKIYNSSLRKTSKLLGNITIEQVSHPIYTAIIGKAGTGIETAIDFYAESSRRRNVEYFHVNCKPGDEAKSASCILQLYQTILGPDVFESIGSVKKRLGELILEAYPRFDEVYRNRLQGQLEDILGINMKYEGMIQTNAQEGAEEIVPLSKSRKSMKRSGVSSNDIVFDVFTTMLIKKQAAICISDVQYCDALSWRFLENLISGTVLKFALLLTITPPEMVSSGTKTRSGVESGVIDDKLLKVIKASGGERNVSYSEEFSHYLTSSAELSFRIFSHVYCTVIELDPLSGQEIKELLCIALGSKKIDQNIVDSVLDVTNGNAFWCKAIVEFIKENGMDEFSQMILKRGNGHNSLKEIILKNIDKLSPEEAMVAKSAAIIGESFNISLLRELLPAQMHNSIARHLEALRQNGIISNSGGSQSDPDFVFQNQLIRNTIYDLTPPSDGSKAHLTIAELILESNSKNLKNQFEMLSYHYRNAHASYRPIALKYTLRAVDDTICRQSFADGIRLLEIGSQLIKSAPECRVMLDLCDVALEEMKPSGIRQFSLYDSNYKLRNELIVIRSKLINFMTEHGGAISKQISSLSIKYEPIEEKETEPKQLSNGLGEFSVSSKSFHDNLYASSTKSQRLGDTIENIKSEACTIS